MYQLGVRREFVFDEQFMVYMILLGVMLKLTSCYNFNNYELRVSNESDKRTSFWWENGMIMYMIFLGVPLELMSFYNLTTYELGVSIKSE